MRSLADLAISAPLRTVIDAAAITVLGATCQPNDLGNLSLVSDELRHARTSDAAVYFSASCALHVATQINPVALVSSMSSLTNALFQQSEIPLADSLLCQWIKLVTELEKLPEGDNHIHQVVNDHLAPLRLQWSTTVSADALRSAPMCDVQNLGLCGRVLTVIEGLLFSIGPPCKTVSTIALCQSQWETALRNIKAEASFLISLSRPQYIKSLVRDLDQSVHFRDPDTTLERVSSSEMQRRARTLSEWLQPFGSDDRAFFKHFVGDKSVESRSVLFQFFYESSVTRRRTPMDRAAGLPLQVFRLQCLQYACSWRICADSIKQGSPCRT
jgi:hypothetical protein